MERDPTLFLRNTETVRQLGPDSTLIYETVRRDHGPRYKESQFRKKKKSKKTTDLEKKSPILKHRKGRPGRPKE